MSSIVQHERPDYEYLPTGLMAEEWGNTGHRTEVAEFLVADRLRRRSWMDNDRSRDAQEYVTELDDATILAALEPGDTRTEIVRRLGGSTNPSRVSLTAANTAYDRDLIDERRLDRIVEEA